MKTKILILAALVALAISTCPNTFPTDGSDNTGGTVSRSVVAAGTFDMQTAADMCDTTTAANDIGYMQAKLGTYVATDLNVANICYAATAGTLASAGAATTFVYTAGGSFTKWDGTTAVATPGSSGDDAKSGSSVDLFTAAIQQIWLYATVATAGTAVTTESILTTTKCFSPATATSAACTYGTATATITADVSTAAAISFAGTPVKGTTVCLFKIEPTSTMNVALTTAATVNNIVCGSQTGTTAYEATFISSATSTTFSSSMKVHCLVIAKDTTQATGTTITVALTAASSSSTTTSGASSFLTTAFAMISALFFVF